MAGLKNLLIFMIGAGIGSGATALAMRKLYLNELDDTVAKIKEEYKIRSAADKYTETSEDVEKSDENEDEPAEVRGFVRTSNDNRTDYTECSAGSSKRKLNSEVITVDEFTEDNGFEKLSFSVFREGMTFINVETEKENKTIAKLITKTILDENDDVDELYVRNTKEQKDIELIFHDCSYLDWLKEERD